MTGILDLAAESVKREEWVLMAEVADQAQAIADAARAMQRGRTERLSVADVEALLRPFAPISHETEHRVRLLLQADHRIFLELGSWMEANDVVQPELTHDRNHRIEFLQMDTCTCVLDHLKAAIAHAPDPERIDPRVLQLLEHPYFSQQSASPEASA